MERRYQKRLGGGPGKKIRGTEKEPRTRVPEKKPEKRPEMRTVGVPRDVQERHGIRRGNRNFRKGSSLQQASGGCRKKKSIRPFDGTTPAESERRETRREWKSDHFNT